MILHYQIIKSPIGDIHIATDTRYLRVLVSSRNWDKYKSKFGETIEKNHPILEKTKRQLEEYFAKRRRTFNIPIFFEGTDFQKKAWRALLNIPYGKTISYATQAENIGSPKAVRAIGGANGANPISIIIPCHRVIGKSGKLTGYASGLDIKEYLLNLENT